MADDSDELIELELSASGLDHARNICGDISGLCSRLCRIASKNLIVTGLVPRGTPMARAEQLDAGGLLGPTKAWGWLARQMGGLHSHNPPTVLLAQDIWMNAADPYTKERVADIRRFSYLGCPYQFMTSQFVQADDIQCFLCSLTSHPVLALSHCHLAFASDDSFPVIYQDTFDEIWRGISQIFVGAYDEESFLVIRPKNKVYFGDLPNCD